MHGGSVPLIPLLEKGRDLVPDLWSTELLALKQAHQDMTAIYTGIYHAYVTPTYSCPGHGFYHPFFLSFASLLVTSLTFL